MRWEGILKKKKRDSERELYVSVFLHHSEIIGFHNDRFVLSHGILMIS